MPTHKCNLCGKIFGSKTDLTRHKDKKNPCVYVDNIKKSMIIEKMVSDEQTIIKHIDINLGEPEDLIYEIELKRIQEELNADLYLHVFNNSEQNIKFKKFYEDAVSKVFTKFVTLCKNKVKKGNSDEYVRDYSLLDEKNKIKTNDVIKKKLTEIYNENETYFNKRLLKYALNLSIGLTDMKYVDVRD